MNLKNQTNSNLFLFIFIFIGLFLIIISGLLIYEELYDSKSYCKSVNGTYSYNLTEKQHLCNQKPIFKYQDGWNFDKTPKILILDTTKQ